MLWEYWKEEKPFTLLAMVAQGILVAKCNSCESQYIIDPIEKAFNIGYNVSASSS